MYGLPKNINLDFFKQQILLQICIGENEVILNFEGDNSETISITIQSKIGVNYNSEIKSFKEMPAAGAALIVFLGKKISNLKYEGSGLLNLEFSKSEQIFLYDDSKRYESYVIRFKDKLIVV